MSEGQGSTRCGRPAGYTLMDASIEERLMEVESRLAFQEEGIQSLSDLVYAQQRQLERLEHSFNLLTQRLQDAAQSEPAKVIDEPPPHY